MTNEELKRFMIDRVGVAMNSGASFGLGGEGFMRLNIATRRSVLAHFIDRLEKEIQAI